VAIAIDDTVENPMALVGPVPAEPRRLRRRTPDDVFSVLGTLLSSLALVWLVYLEMLPFSGALGFIVCWYFTFLAMYAGVTALAHARPVVIDRLMAAVVTLGAILVGLALVTVVWYTGWNGRHALHHLNFFTQDGSRASATTALTKGGIKHAIVGSAIQMGIAVAIALPLGLATAVYMTEVGGWFARIVRTVVEAMTAIPDLLAGLFVYVVLILDLHSVFHIEKVGIAAAIAIAVTMTPIIARSAEVALRVVPGGLREAGMALGASHWRTVVRVVLPTARSGLATSLILAVARGVGESAPLLIVSAASQFWNVNPLRQPMNSLPLYIYSQARTGQPLAIDRAFGAATVLLAIVFVLFIVARLIARPTVGRR
jgi:phosphate transport system permease protein